MAVKALHQTPTPWSALSKYKLDLKFNLITLSEQK